MRPTDWGRELPERRLDSDGSAARASQHPIMTEARRRTRAKDWESSYLGAWALWESRCVSIPIPFHGKGNVGKCHRPFWITPLATTSPQREQVLASFSTSYSEGRKGNRGTHPYESIVIFRPIRGSSPFVNSIPRITPCAIVCRCSALSRSPRAPPRLYSSRSPTLDHQPFSPPDPPTDRPEYEFEYEPFPSEPPRPCASAGNLLPCGTPRPSKKLRT